MTKSAQPNRLQLEAADGGPSPFANDVIKGLSRSRKSIPPQWFYDARGSELFEEITAQPEYYPTRTEITILRDASRELAALLGPDAVLVEPGSGSSVKTEIVLGAMERPAQYVGIEISGTALGAAAERLQSRYPDLLVTTQVGDFTTVDTIHDALAGHPRHVFFPGSTIGNFEPLAAGALLGRFGGLCSRDGVLLIGIDLRKSLDVLIPAYDDRAGVTAAFNLNLLRRINRELGGTFDVSAFEHRVRYDMAENRIEMHLVARSAQRVVVSNRTFEFAAGETIHTENSYKYTIEAFAALAGSAGLSVTNRWLDARGWFALVALRPT